MECCVGKSGEKENFKKGLRNCRKDLKLAEKKKKKKKKLQIPEFCSQAATMQEALTKHLGPKCVQQQKNNSNPLLCHLKVDMNRNHNL